MSFSLHLTSRASLKFRQHDSSHPSSLSSDLSETLTRLKQSSVSDSLGCEDLAIAAATAVAKCGEAVAEFESIVTMKAFQLL